MKKQLYNGKTQKEWIEQLSDGFSSMSFLKEGKIQDDSKNIIIYFDNNGNILSENIVEALQHFCKTYGFLSTELKNQLNIDDDWEENCICISSEDVCQLLFFLNREDILSTIKDMMNCLCK